MSGKAKRRDDDGASDTDSNSEGHVSPKKSLKKDYDDDPDSITICEVVRCPASVPGRASSIKTVRIPSIDLRELVLLGKSCRLVSRRW